MPLVLAVGLAIDASTIASTRSNLQHAIDSAVLAVAREGKDVSNDKADAIAGQFLTRQFRSCVHPAQGRQERYGIQRQAPQTNAGLAFGSLFGYQDWPVQAAATADIAYASYEIALVLDTTGSMKGGKLASMKDAVLGLIGTMSVQVDDTDKLKFAVVPFSAFVNVGPKYGPSFRQEGQADRRYRRPLAGPPGQIQGAAVRTRRRRQPLPALQQCRPDLAGLRRDALLGQQGLRRRRHAGRSGARRRRCSFRLSASTSRIRRNSPTATSAPTPSRRTSPSRKRRSAGRSTASKPTRRACRCSAGCSIRLSFALGDLLGSPIGKKTIKIDTSPSGATARPRGRAMAATFSRSRR